MRPYHTPPDASEMRPYLPPLDASEMRPYLPPPDASEMRPYLHCAMKASILSGLVEAVRQWRARSLMPTRLGSAELRKLRSEIRDRSIFSAKVLSERLLHTARKAIADILQGRDNMATGRLRLQETLEELRAELSPEEWDDQFGATDPEDAGTVKDITSRRRKDLILETNVRQARNRALMLSGSDEFSRYEYPAWELLRIFDREVPRGQKRGKNGLVPNPGQSWERRWTMAGSAVNWEGVALPKVTGGRMIARKDSEIWAELGDGAGGFKDSLLQPFPPFAFWSGLGWREVTRSEALDLGLVGEGLDEVGALPDASLSPTGPEIKRATEHLEAAGISTERLETFKRDLDASLGGKTMADILKRGLDDAAKAYAEVHT